MIRDWKKQSYDLTVALSADDVTHILLDMDEKDAAEIITETFAQSSRLCDLVQKWLKDNPE